MSLVKKFTDVKINGVGGGVSVGSSAAASVSPVPCKGARMVIYRFRATDANGFAGTTANAGNTPDGSLLHSGGSIGLSIKGSAIRMNAVGGITLCVLPEAATGRFIWDYVQFIATANAAGHTALAVDVEVVYDGDENDARVSFGQATAQPT